MSKIPVVRIHSDAQSSDKLRDHSLVLVFSAVGMHKSVRNMNNHSCARARMISLPVMVERGPGWRITLGCYSFYCCNNKSCNKEEGGGGGGWYDTWKTCFFLLRLQSVCADDDFFVSTQTQWCCGPSEDILTDPFLKTPSWLEYGRNRTNQRASGPKSQIYSQGLVKISTGSCC